MGIAKFLEKKVTKHLPALARALQRSMSDTKKIELIKNEMRSRPELIDSFFPYKDKYPVNSKMPANSSSKDEVMRQIKDMHAIESIPWENGKISGSFYPVSYTHLTLPTNREV